MPNAQRKFKDFKFNLSIVMNKRQEEVKQKGKWNYKKRIIKLKTQNPKKKKKDKGMFFKRTG